MAPVGVSASIDISMPSDAHTTEVATEHIVTVLKLLNTLIADSAGNTTNADTKSAPTRFIANTITTATITAMIRLYIFAFIPVATAKSSSNVTEKILL